MLGPLFRLATQQPQLLAEHLEAYGALAAGEWLAARTLWQRQGAWALLAVLAGVAALLLAGMALLLCGALPPDTMPRPWLLWAVPLLPAAVALIAAQRAKAMAAPTFAALRHQWAADSAVLRAAESQ